MLSERDVLGAIPGPPRVGGPDHPVPEPALGHDEGRSPDLLPSWVTGQGRIPDFPEQCVGKDGL